MSFLRIQSVFVFFLVYSSSVFSQPKVEILFNYKRGSYKGSYYDVIVTKNGVKKNLTWFKPWDEVNETILSPDNKYLLVRHKPQHGRSYLLSMYNLETMKLMKTMAPGHGGEINWNTNHQLVHSWGCGTNCANVLVYDVQLKPIFYTLSSGGFYFSPDYRYVVQFSMHADKLWIFDLYSIHNGSHALAFTMNIDSSYESNSFHFPNNSSAEMRVKEELRVKPITLNFKKLKWKRLDPKKMGEFYSREF
jgi:hypothetical protein